MKVYWMKTIQIMTYNNLILFEVLITPDFSKHIRKNNYIQLLDACIMPGPSHKARQLAWRYGKGATW